HTGELAVGDLDAIARHRTGHGAERIVAHLIAEAPRARMDHDGHLAGMDAERRRAPLVVDLIDALDLEEVIPGAERAHLRPASLECRLRDQVRIRAGETSALLGRLEVRAAAEAACHRPCRP